MRNRNNFLKKPPLGKRTISRKFVTSPKNSSNEGRKGHFMAVFNLVLSLATVIITFWGIVYVIRQFNAERIEQKENFEYLLKQMKQASDQFIEQMDQARQEFKYQRSKDSIQSLEDDKKFRENVKLTQGQVKALQAITEYNLAAQKPFFQSEFKVGFTNARDNNKHLVLYSGLKNAGIRPSSDLWTYLTLIDIGFNGIRKEMEFSSPNGIPPNQEYRHGEDIDLVNGHDFKVVAPFYLYALICYSDPILKEQIQQRFYYKWTNETQNELEPSLQPASWKEAEAIDFFLKKNNHVPYCRH